MRHTRFILAALFALGLSLAAHAETYTVKRGDVLIRIAAAHGVSVQDMLIANGEYLIGKYREVCGKKPPAYVNSPTRRGYFCNDAKKSREPVHANTLKAGWQLTIPPKTASATVEQVIASTPGKRVALVVDATASMGGNIGRVAVEYRIASQTYGKSIVGVWFFADGEVWLGKPDDLLALPTRGNIENTYGALQKAQESSPDLIVLITDEPGDDWPSGAIAKFAPIIAHCLPEGGDGEYSCAPTLKRLVAATPGSRYVQGVSQATPLASSDISAGSGTVPPVKRVRPSTPPAQTDGPWYKGIFGQ